jgi:SAM-dependent methyltransferase
VPDLHQRQLFDIGCGSGGLVEYLATSGVPVAGACDTYVERLTIVRQRPTAPLVLEDEGRLPPLGHGYSLVTLFDVLEHIDDDHETLRFLSSVLRPGGVRADDPEALAAAVCRLELNVALQQRGGEGGAELFEREASTAALAMVLRAVLAGSAAR